MNLMLEFPWIIDAVLYKNHTDPHFLESFEQTGLPSDDFIGIDFVIALQP